MNAGAHVLIGAGTTGLVFWGLNAAGVQLEPTAIGLGVAAAGVGALLPDIDHPRSTASRALPREMWNQGVSILVPLLLLAVAVALFGGRGAGEQLLSVFAPVLKWGAVLAAVAVGFLAVSFLIRAVSGHRGITHSLVFAAAATLVASLACGAFGAPWWCGVLLGWGWLTHLAADAPSTAGLPSLFWPFGEMRLSGSSPGGGARSTTWLPPTTAEAPLPDTPEVSVPSRRSRSASPTMRRETNPRQRVLVGLARIAVLALLAWWLLLGGGRLWLVGVTTSVLGGAVGSTTGEPGSVTATDPGIARAQELLKERAPTVYYNVDDVDSPEITRSGINTTYTWRYVEANGNQAQVKRISITLDPAGDYMSHEFGD